MSERVKFVMAYEAGHGSMTDLCAVFQVSRKTGYKWLERYRLGGFESLVSRSHAPHVHGRATAATVVEAIVGLRRREPRWGPRKLVGYLSDRQPEIDWPSPSTAGELIRRAGLVTGRRLRRRVPASGLGLTEATHANHVWRADHKGWFRSRDGARIEPLTVTDGFSRYLIVLSAGDTTKESEAKLLFEQAFRDYGMPEVIRTDNGTPFASPGPTGLSTLSAWWTRLGIRHERIDPGKPTQNGSHERFHATLKEAIEPPAADRTDQAARFEAFRAHYNTVRPHQALGQKPPVRYFRPDARPFPNTIPEPAYPEEAAVRSVRSNGEIKCGGELVFLSTVLAGQRVALTEDDDGHLEVRYYERVLGSIDPRTLKFRPPAAAPRGGRGRQYQPDLLPIHPV
jgi:transposase InsO family protein